MKRMIILAWIVGALIALVGVIALIGAMLPVEHVAACRAQYRQSPETIWSALTDIAMFPAWRSELKSVEMVENDPEHPVWKETGSFGTITMERTEAERPRRIVGRIVGTESGFGGGWTYELTPDGDGTTLTITERGQVYNPIFRFMSRFIFGHTRTIIEYERELGAKYGERVEPAVVTE